MEEQVSSYLQQLNKYLGKLDQQEREDILEEVESHIFESISNGSSIDQTLDALGSPKALANSYAGESLLKNGSFNLANLMKLLKFYFITGFSGMFIIPCVGIISITFYFCSFIIVAGGIIKTIGLFFGYSLPIVVLNFGFWEAPDFLALPVCLLVGFLLYVSSKKMWYWLKDYLLKISTAHRKLKNSN